MIVNLPKMLHEALLRGQMGSEKALEHAQAVLDKAKASGTVEDDIAAIHAFQVATETQGAYAETVARIMMAIDDNDDNCPDHGCRDGDKPS